MISLKGFVRYRLWNKAGQVKCAGQGSNLVTVAGKNRAAAVLVANSGSPSALQFVLALGMGDSGTTVVDTQTALQGTELFLPRFILVPSRTNNIIQYAAFANNAGALVTVREWGLFTAASAGIMIARFLPNEFQFANGDTLGLTWSLEIG